MSFIKYPRTFHVPWSLGKTSDDKVLKSADHFVGKEIVITEKMDGENTSIYKEGLHARSLDSKRHESRTMVTKLWSEIAHDIPENWRICGENLFAKHSLKYDSLEAYFLAFSIWNEKNICLSWDETVEWCDILSVKHVPVLYTGLYDYDTIREIEKNINFEKSEGYVIRMAQRFSFDLFETSVAKFVRQNHVQTVKHWMNAKIEKNDLL